MNPANATETTTNSASFPLVPVPTTIDSITDDQNHPGGERKVTTEAKDSGNGTGNGNGFQRHAVCFLLTGSIASFRACEKIAFGFCRRLHTPFRDSVLRHAPADRYGALRDFIETTLLELFSRHRGLNQQQLLASSDLIYGPKLVRQKLLKSINQCRCCGRRRERRSDGFACVHDCPLPSFLPIDAQNPGSDDGDGVAFDLPARELPSAASEILRYTKRYGRRFTDGERVGLRVLHAALITGATNSDCARAWARLTDASFRSGRHSWDGFRASLRTSALGTDVRRILVDCVQTMSQLTGY